MFELVSIEAQPHQPDPEGEQLVLALRLAHDGAALGDGLGGDGQAQIYIGGHFPGVEGRIKAPPFDSAAVKNRMKI